MNKLSIDETYKRFPFPVPFALNGESYIRTNLIVSVLKLHQKYRSNTKRKYNEYLLSFPGYSDRVTLKMISLNGLLLHTRLLSLAMTAAALAILELISASSESVLDTVDSE